MVINYIVLDYLDTAILFRFIRFVILCSNYYYTFCLDYYIWEGVGPYFKIVLL